MINIPIPRIEDLVTARPDLSDIEFVDTGGFKVVFKAKVKRAVEAVKLVYLPPPSETDEGDDRSVIEARVKREIGVLERCKTECLVRLGAIQLEPIRVGDHDYLLYSEEFVPGASLRQRIKAKSCPAFIELKALLRSLMLALDAINSIGHIHRDVIGGWMLINYTLSQQGLSVVNGCSDILSAFMGAAGGDMGATGWWSNLRAFSLGRYVQSEKKGGQQPSIRYLSKLLLNRITVDERSRFLEFLPSVNNRLASDDAFDSGVPDRSTETVQNWEALSSLIADSSGGSTEENLIHLAKTITAAKEAYAELAGHGFSEGIESVNAYLEALEGGLEVFRKYAEI